MSLPERWDPWKESDLHGFLLPPVLKDFAGGLRQAWWAWLLLGIGGGIYGCHLLLGGLPGGGTLLTGAALAAIAGVILTTWSKGKCYEFAAPISGRWAIVAAFWLDLAAIGLRFAGRQFKLGGGPVRLLAGLCLLASLVCFLIFLDHLCRLVARNDLRRSVWAVFAAMTAAIVSPFLWMGLVLVGRLREAPIAAVSFWLIGVCSVTGFLIYGWLLSRLSRALVETATFMEQADLASDEEFDEDETASA